MSALLRLLCEFGMLCSFRDDRTDGMLVGDHLYRRSTTASSAIQSGNSFTSPLSLFLVLPRWVYLRHTTSSAQVETKFVLQICISVSPKYFAPRYRLLRTGLFVSMGLTGVIPLLHALAKYGVSWASQ